MTDEKGFHCGFLHRKKKNWEEKNKKYRKKVEKK